jgi:predicted molibdopterin-dependent oxidoreductase YjgC
MTKWMNINGKRVVFEEGETLLEVATKAGIYIPTLCARPDLPSIGACRLCIVEVEGSRVYPNSCTLPAREGMVVRTETPDLQAVRRNIFQLILAEHPSYCLVCKEQNECARLRHGEYKAGRVIGCYTCSHKELCEIRKISDYLRIKEIRFPVLYKNLPLERDDPFLVRDYNLCIICARCVRACQDVLGYSAIALTKRGHDTKVGTLLDISHLESGCVFCGHCIDVCPTGALTARGSTWFGSPDKSITTTCVLCSHGCQMVADVKWDKVVNVHPPYDMSARREYCVKGRFCIPALVNGRDRLKYPSIKRKVLKEEQFPVSWDEAINHIAERLKSFTPEEIGFLVSPFLTDETIFLFNKLSKEISSNDLAYNNEGLQILAERGIKALYATFNSKSITKIASLEVLFVQDIYHHSNYESAEVIVPTTAFTEEDGTKTGVEYMKYKVKKAVEPPGIALPSWLIVSRLAQALGLKEFSYKTIDDIQDEIMRREPIDVPLISKQSLEYMGTPIGEKVEEFALFLNAKRIISKSKGRGMEDVKI